MRKTRKPNRLKRIAAALSVLVLVAVTASLGTAIWVESALQRIPVFTPYEGRPTTGAGTNWLLVGSDSRADLSPEQQEQLATGGDVGSGRTDTILLVHIPDAGSGVPTAMVSIPRDSYVNIPGWGMDKINAAYAVGGPAMLAQTVEEASGLRLDHYAEVGFAGFGAVVDALGGVRVCPSEPINDPLAGIDLPAGCQTLDGPQALGYVRTRATAKADLDRMLNQREFMATLLHRASSPLVWLNPWRWYAVPHALVAAMYVDEGAHVWDLARLAMGLLGSDVRLTVPVGQIAENEVGSVVLWNSESATALFDALRTDSVIPQQVYEDQP